MSCGAKRSMWLRSHRQSYGVTSFSGRGLDPRPEGHSPRLRVVPPAEHPVAVQRPAAPAPAAMAWQFPVYNYREDGAADAGARIREEEGHGMGVPGGDRAAG